MEFIKQNASNNYTNKLWWMWITLGVSVCVIIVLAVQWACNQTYSGRFHSAINEGVCSPWGKRMDPIGWRRGKALMNVCGVIAARSRVCVSSYKGLFSVRLSPQYLFISHTRCSRGCMRGGGGMEGCGSGEKGSKKRLQMRSEQQSVVVVLRGVECNAM